MSERSDNEQAETRASRPNAFAMQAPEPISTEYNDHKPSHGWLGSLGGATAVRAVLLVLLVAAGVAISQLLVSAASSVNSIASTLRSLSVKPDNACEHSMLQGMIIRTL